MSVSYSEIQEIALADLYRRLMAGDDSSSISIENGVIQEFGDLIGITDSDDTPEVLVSLHEKALLELVRLGYMDETAHSRQIYGRLNDNPFATRRYEISAKGLKRVEEQQRNQGSSIANYLKNLSLKSASPIIAPASDRNVTISHNQPEYAETIKAVETVIQEFQNDHRLDNELGHEKGALLKALKGGRELLKDTTINVRVATALLMEPLHRLIAKYDRELVAVTATAALDLVVKLLGIG